MVFISVLFESYAATVMLAFEEYQLLVDQDIVLAIGVVEASSSSR